MSLIVEIFKDFLHPVNQYCALVNGAHIKSILQLIDDKIISLLKIIFFERIFDFISNLCDKNEIYNSQELHIYGLTKLLINILRNECRFKNLQECIYENYLVI